MKKRVMVIFGGCSTEYEVSLKSATAVIHNLDREKYDILLVGITREGKWYRYYGEIEKISTNEWWREGKCAEAVLSLNRGENCLIEIQGDRLQRTGIDVAFPVLHGKNGEDGTLQGIFELAGIPFVGCDTLSSAICMDKDIAHTLVKAAGIKVPDSFALYTSREGDNFLEAAREMKFPVFVKPAKAGSSIGITKVMNSGELKEAIKEAFSFDSKVVIEENIVGFEVGCAVLGTKEPVIGAVDEIELIGGFFNYKEKYTLETSKIHLPARVDQITADKIKETARVIYKVLCCEGFARVDMFLTPENEIIFNEVNTIPGFTTKSRYPAMLGEIGYSYGRILDVLIAHALER